MKDGVIALEGKTEQLLQQQFGYSIVHIRSNSPSMLPATENARLQEQQDQTFIYHVKDINQFIHDLVTNNIRVLHLQINPPSLNELYRDMQTYLTISGDNQ